MSDKEITVEEMVGGLYEMTHESCDQYDGEHPKRLREIREAIRKLILDYAELTKKLSEVKLDVQNPNRLDMGKPKVTRKKIRIVCDDLHYAPSVEELQDCLEENLWAWGITIVDDKETPDE